MRLGRPVPAVLLAALALGALAVPTAATGTTATPVGTQIGDPTSRTEDFITRPRERDGSGQRTDRAPSAAGTASRFGLPGRYDVHVFSLDTGDGPAGTSADQSSAMVRRLDEEFDRETSGRYRFAMAAYSVLPATTARGVCGVDTIDQTYASTFEALRPRSGAAGVIWVVVTPRGTGCHYSGQAFIGHGGVHMNDPRGWDPRSAVPVPSRSDPPAYIPVMRERIFAHEVGHTLGLWHASAYRPGVPHAEMDPDHVDHTTVEEYGDESDTMGGAFYGLRLNGVFRDYLTLVPAARKAAATSTSTTYTIQHVDSAAGTTLVYVPLDDQQMFSLEYRHHDANDWPLWWMSPNQEGVHVRMQVNHGVGARAVTVPPVEAEREDPDRPRQAFRAGESLTLSDGTTVEVVSTNGVSAQVRVTRPVDRTAPTLDAALRCHAWRAGVCHFDSDADAETAVDVAALGDDRWLARLTVRHDGTGADLFDTSWSPTASPTGRRERPDEVPLRLPQGSYTLTVTATDTAGNPTARTFPVRVAPVGTPTPDPDPGPGPDPDPVARPGRVSGLVASKATRTSVVVRWSPPSAGDGGRQVGYRVRYRVRGGTWKVASSTVGALARTWKVGRLRPRTRYDIAVQARNAAGYGPARVVRARTKR